MTISRKILRATGNGGFPVREDFSASDFMSSWWCVPKAVESGGRVYVSSVQSTGASKVLSFANDDPTDTDSFTLMTNESDDHNAAALLVPTDKPPLVAYSRHALDQVLRFRKGTVIGDITSLGAQTTVTFGGNTTYAQLWRLPGTDEVHAWTRETVSGDSRYWSNLYSTDYGDSWTAERRVFDFGAGEQGYIGTVPIASDPTRLRVALTGHPTSSTIHDIYYCEIEQDTGEIRKQDGTSLGNIKDGTSLPVVVTAECDKIVDTDTGGGHNARLSDVGDGPDPEVAYLDWTSDTNAIYYRTVYSGGSWSSSSIVAAGVTFGFIATTHYHGGATFPRDTPGDVVYLSRESSGTWAVERWRFAGGAWERVQVLTKTTATKVVRPQPIADATRGKVTWHDVSSYPADGTGYTDWAADLVVDRG